MPPRSRTERSNAESLAKPPVGIVRPPNQPKPKLAERSNAQSQLPVPFATTAACPIAFDVVQNFFVVPLLGFVRVAQLGVGDQALGEFFVALGRAQQIRWNASAIALVLPDPESN